MSDKKMDTLQVDAIVLKLLKKHLSSATRNFVRFPWIPITTILILHTLIKTKLTLFR